jgi:hypothetical protein
MKILPGDIILVKGDTPIVSSLVRWFTRSPYTHVGLAVTSDLIYEIDINKDLAIRPIHHKHYDVFRYKYGLTETQQHDMQVYALERAKENVGYDWLKILGFGIERIFRFHKAFNELNHVVCSEIVDNIYNHVGIDLVPNREDGDVTPALFISKNLIKVYSFNEA